jgi:TRAP-type C4-dicarboxylate transport system permease large subunit
MITIWLLSRINPKIAPAAENPPMKEKISSIKNVWPTVLLFVFIMVGIYGGFFTPPEAGGLGAFAALLIVFFMRRLSKKYLPKLLWMHSRPRQWYLSSLSVLIFSMRFMFAFRTAKYLSNLIIDFQSSYNVAPIVHNHNH